MCSLSLCDARSMQAFYYQEDASMGSSGQMTFERNLISQTCLTDFIRTEKTVCHLP